MSRLKIAKKDRRGSRSPRRSPNFNGGSRVAVIGTRSADTATAQDHSASGEGSSVSEDHLSSDEAGSPASRIGTKKATMVYVKKRSSSAQEEVKDRVRSALYDHLFMRAFNAAKRFDVSGSGLYPPNYASGLSVQEMYDEVRKLLESAGYRVDMSFRSEQETFPAEEIKKCAASTFSALQECIGSGYDPPFIDKLEPYYPDPYGVMRSDVDIMTEPPGSPKRWSPSPGPAVEALPAIGQLDLATLGSPERLRRRILVARSPGSPRRSSPARSSSNESQPEDLEEKLAPVSSGSPITKISPALSVEFSQAEIAKAHSVASKDVSMDGSPAVEGRSGTPLSASSPIRSQFRQQTEQLNQLTTSLNQITEIISRLGDRYSGVDEKIASVNKRIDEKISQVGARMDDQISQVSVKVNDQFAQANIKTDEKISQIGIKMDERLSQVDRGIQQQMETARMEDRRHREKMEAAQVEDRRRQEERTVIMDRQYQDLLAALQSYSTKIANVQKSSVQGNKEPRSQEEIPRTEDKKSVKVKIEDPDDYDDGSLPFSPPPTSVAATKIRQAAVPDLKEFSGQRKDEYKAREWLERAQAAFSRDQLTEEEMIQQFPELLKRASKNWYRQLDREVKLSWSSLLKAFKNEYCQDEISPEQKYYSLSRSQNEDPLDYLYRLNTQAKRAKKDLKGSFALTHIDRFINTCEDESLRSKLMPLDITSAEHLAEILKKMRRRGHVDRRESYSRSRSRKSIHEVKHDTSSDSSDSSEISNSDHDCDSDSSGSSDNRRSSVAAASKMYKGEKSRDRGRDHSRDHDREGKAKRDPCSHCGSEKHEDRKCWKSVTCGICERVGHPSDHCWRACRSCLKIHNQEPCPMKEISQALQGWYDPVQHAGILPDKVTQWLN